MGQYEFPFTFRLPKSMPNSFSIGLQDEEHHAYSIRYTLTAYFDSEEPVLHCTVPITVSAGIKDPIRRARSKNLDAQRSQFMNESNMLNQSNDQLFKGSLMERTHAENEGNMDATLDLIDEEDTKLKLKQKKELGNAYDTLN